MTSFKVIAAIICGTGLAAAAQPPLITLTNNLMIEVGSAADVSVLINPPRGTGRPAGTHGVLTNALDQFQFEDGQAVRFWGVNWPATEPVPSGEQAAQLALRLTRQGVNLLRSPLPATNNVEALRHFEEFSGFLRGQGIYLDLLLGGDSKQLARTNSVTHFAPRDDAGVALFEFGTKPKTRTALRAPATAAGPWRTARELAALGPMRFLSQTASWLSAKPMLRSSVTMFGAMGFGAGVEQPMLVGSWRGDLPLWTAAVASFQRWAGICSSTDSRDVVAWIWAPASALLFHRGDVAPAKSKMLFHFSAEEKTLNADHEQFAAAVNIGMMRFAFGAAEDPAGWMVLRGTELAAVAAVNPRESDTGEIVHDWQAGQLQINTPRTQALIGFQRLPLAETRDLRLTFVGTNDVRFVAVALTSLDGAPLSKSQRLLLTATGLARAAGVEPVEAAVTLKWLAPSQHDRKIFALDLSGHRAQEIPLEERGFKMKPELKAAWYEIIAEVALPKPPQTNAPPAKVEQPIKSPEGGNHER